MLAVIVTERNASGRMLDLVTKRFSERKVCGFVTDTAGVAKRIVYPLEEHEFLAR